jgi:hypothetical protein
MFLKNLQKKNPEILPAKSTKNKRFVANFSFFYGKNLYNEMKL